MHLIAIAWIYVVLMMAVAEALSSQGTVLGAVVTFVLYGVLPLSILMYILGTPGRRRLRQRAESSALSAVQSTGPSVASSTSPPDALSDSPDRGSHAAGDAVASERKEP